MPELPEVETVRRGLMELVQGETITEILVYYPQIITNDTEEFKIKLQGQKIEQIKRRGKYLIFELTDYDILSHLRMEGKYQMLEHVEDRDKHTHVIFNFASGKHLAYRDVRKFGRMTLYPKGEALHSKSILQLGPEPTAQDFALDTFMAKLKKARKPIKPLLLEQKLVTGLGNIYVDEVLFKAGIHPERAANSLTETEMTQLHHQIIQTLQTAIKYRGTTIRSYENAFGENGTYQNHLEVYGRAGEPCVKCGTEIQKIKLGGRGTHFCPNCQVMK